MLKIGKLTVEGQGRRPASRDQFKADIQDFARNLGLRIRFVTRKRDTVSYCDVWTGNAVVCEGLGDHVYPLKVLIEFTLHEIAHWIQFNEGMFQGYFGTPYYGGVKQGSRSGLKRLALRAERHADQIAEKLMLEMYGMESPRTSIYHDYNLAKEFLSQHHKE